MINQSAPFAQFRIGIIKYKEVEHYGRKKG
jgi:hypothetical protein